MNRNFESAEMIHYLVNIRVTFQSEFEENSIYYAPDTPTVWYLGRLCSLHITVVKLVELENVLIMV